ncbi:signal peptidase II [Porticoccus sp.]
MSRVPVSGACSPDAPVSMAKPNWLLARWYVLAVLVVILDQLSKLWVSSALHYAETVQLLPFLNLTLVHNPGAAFSFLSDAGGWQRWLFALIGIAVSLVIVVWIARLAPSQRLLSLALSLILGGAVGNLWDRAILGHVIDFIDLYYHGRHWPAFNLADSAITLGAVLLVVESLFAGGVKKEEANNE